MDQIQEAQRLNFLIINDDVVVELCPKCGTPDLEHWHIDATFAHPEAIITSCMQCQWQSDPQ